MARRKPQLLGTHRQLEGLHLASPEPASSATPPSMLSVRNNHGSGSKIPPDFASISNVSTFDVELAKIDGFLSINNVNTFNVAQVQIDNFSSIKEKQDMRGGWNKVLLFLVIFSILSLFTLLVANGFDFFEMTESQIRLYRNVCLAIIALSVYPLKYLFGLSKTKGRKKVKGKKGRE